MHFIGVHDLTRASSGTWESASIGSITCINYVATDKTANVHVTITSITILSESTTRLVLDLSGSTSTHGLSLLCIRCR